MKRVPALQINKLKFGSRRSDAEGMRVFGMPIKGVEAYRASEAKNETLAMSNLGNRLLNLGFLPEAQQEADKAMTIKPYHKNIPALLVRLRDAPEEEGLKLTQTLEKVREKAAFYRKVGEGVLRATPTNISPKWNSPEGPVELEMDGTSVRIFGTQERPLNAFAAFIHPLGGSGAHSMMAMFRIEYSGQVRGNVIIGQVKRSRDGEVPSALGSIPDNVKTVMVLNEDHSEIFVMEGPDGSAARFFTLTRFS